MTGFNASAVALSESFESAEQTITTAGLLSIAHGLSGAPSLLEIILVCKTAEDGYSIGDTIFYNGGNSSSAYDQYGVATVPDAVNIVCRYGSASDVFFVPNKTTGTAGGLTNVNWRMIVRAWR